MANYLDEKGTAYLWEKIINLMQEGTCHAAIINYGATDYDTAAGLINKAVAIIYNSKTYPVTVSPFGKRLAFYALDYGTAPMVRVFYLAIDDSWTTETIALDSTAGSGTGCTCTEPSTWAEGRAIDLGNGITGYRFVGSLVRTDNGFFDSLMKCSENHLIADCGGDIYMGGLHYALGHMESNGLGSWLYIDNGSTPSLTLECTTAQLSATAEYDIWVKLKEREEDYFCLVNEANTENSVALPYTTQDSSASGDRDTGGKGSESSAAGGSTARNIEYKADNGDWTALTQNTTVRFSDRLYLRGTNPNGLTLNDTDYFTLNPTDKFSVTGMLQTLTGPINASATYAFAQLFYRASNLYDADTLNMRLSGPLTAFCFAEMFQNCTNLKNPPVLPALTLAANCYQGMFLGCSRMTYAPELPATTMATQCYINMFNSCSQLTSAPELPATNLAEGCYINMFSYCANLPVAPALPATTLQAECYRGMFIRCTTLAAAPTLPASRLVNNCYERMFVSCSKLARVEAHFLAISGTDSLLNWLQGVKSTGVYRRPQGATYATSGVMPTGWTLEIISDSGSGGAA